MSVADLIDSSELIVYAYVTPDGYAHVGGTTQDWEYVAQFFRQMADEADRKAAEASRCPRCGEPTTKPLDHQAIDDGWEWSCDAHAKRSSDE